MRCSGKKFCIVLFMVTMLLFVLQVLAFHRSVVKEGDSINDGEERQICIKNTVSEGLNHGINLGREFSIQL